MCNAADIFVQGYIPVIGIMHIAVLLVILLIAVNSYEICIDTVVSYLYRGETA